MSTASATLNSLLCTKCQDVIRGHWVEQECHGERTNPFLVDGENQYCLGRLDWMHTLSTSPNDDLAPSLFLHHSVPDLAVSADSGCPFCSVIHDCVCDAQPKLYQEYREVARNAIGVVVVRPGYVDEETDRVVLEIEITYLRDGKCDSRDVYTPMKAHFCLESVHEPLHGLNYKPSGGITVPPALVHLIKTWTSHCQMHHALCSRRDVSSFSDASANANPTRLIDVSSGGDNRFLRLCETSSFDGPVSYITLSHCWGDISPVRLLTTNRDEFTMCIELNSLPRTFQEAIFFIRALGIRYLWIDTLCIIQDSEKDWLRESQRMVHVFSRAFLNIAATASSNGQGGLFRKRDLSLISPGKVATSWTGHPAGYYRLVDPSIWERRVEDGPLNQRAWVFQERMLAPRTVHFARDQVWWECAMTRACESYPDQLPDMVYQIANGSPALMTMNLERGNNIEGNDIWVTYLQFYTKKHITRDSDRLVALAGVAASFSRIMEWPEKDYFAGFWRYDLAVDLLWNMSEPGNRDLTCYVAPSWSWASVKGQVNFDSTAYRNIIRENIAIEIIDVDLQYVDSRFGHVHDGSIFIHGPMYAIRFSDAHPDFPRIMQRLTISDMRNRQIQSLSQEDFEEIFDDDQLYDRAATAGIQAYWCKFVTYLPPNGQAQFASLGLVLQNAPDIGPGCYRRTGWLRVDHTTRNISDAIPSSGMSGGSGNADNMLIRIV